MSQKSNRIFYILELCFFIIFFSGVIILFGEAVIDANEAHNEIVVKELLYSTGSAVAQTIQKNITITMDAAETLGSFLESNNFNTNDFDIWAEGILKPKTPIECLQLAPRGVVKDIYPLNDHQGAIGHDLINDSKRDGGALEAIHYNSVFFVGPIKLIQNGKLAVIARKPIYKDNVFWGFTIAIIYVEDLIPTELLNSTADSIMYTLYGYNPDSSAPPILAQSKRYIPKNEIKIDVAVPKGTWELYLSYEANQKVNKTLFRIVSHGIASILSILIIIQQLYIRRKRLQVLKLNKKLRKLSFHDSLTGIRNRRSGLHILENVIDQSYRYGDNLCLGLIDVDDFKKINDTYGHTTGDKALISIANKLRNSTRKSDILLRYGGDEFCLIFPRTNIEEAKIISNKVCRRIKESKLENKSKSIPLSVSIGVGCYKKGDTLTELLDKADKALYKSKTGEKGTVST